MMAIRMMKQKKLKDFLVINNPIEFPYVNIYETQDENGKIFSFRA